MSESESDGSDVSIRQPESYSKNTKGFIDTKVPIECPTKFDSSDWVTSKAILLKTAKDNGVGFQLMASTPVEPTQRVEYFKDGVKKTKVIPMKEFIKAARPPEISVEEWQSQYLDELGLGYQFKSSAGNVESDYEQALRSCFWNWLKVFLKGSDAEYLFDNPDLKGQDMTFVFRSLLKLNVTKTSQPMLIETAQAKLAAYKPHKNASFTSFIVDIRKLIKAITNVGGKPDPYTVRRHINTSVHNNELLRLDNWSIDDEHCDSPEEEYERMIEYYTQRTMQFTQRERAAREAMGLFQQTPGMMGQVHQNSSSSPKEGEKKDSRVSTLETKGVVVGEMTAILVINKRVINLREVMAVPPEVGRVEKVHRIRAMTPNRKVLIEGELAMPKRRQHERRQGKRVHVSSVTSLVILLVNAQRGTNHGQTLRSSRLR